MVRDFSVHSSGRAVSQADPACWLAGEMEGQGDEAEDQREFFRRSLMAHSVTGKESKGG